MAAWYSSSVHGFLLEDATAVLATLVRQFQHHQLLHSQIEAWTQEIGLLRGAFAALVGELPAAAAWGVLAEKREFLRNKYRVL
jgi:hypothetical protein